jgi:hypothetical protein
VKRPAAAGAPGWTFRGSGRTRSLRTAEQTD